MAQGERVTIRFQGLRSPPLRPKFGFTAEGCETANQRRANAQALKRVDNRERDFGLTGLDDHMPPPPTIAGWPASLG